MNTITITTVKNRFDKRGRQGVYDFFGLSARLRISTQTDETHAEFLAWKKARSDQSLDKDRRRDAAKKEANAKDHGGFVGGTFEGNQVDGQSVKTRGLITLDADNAAPEILDKVRETGYAAIIYSTHSHGGTDYKLRIVLNVSREMTPEEYQAVSRRVAEGIGLDYFDKVSFTPAQIMYWPSHSRDVTPVYEYFEGAEVDVDAVLATYADYKDPAEWPGVSDAAEVAVKHVLAADPAAKQGIVGDFCMAYTVPDAIEKYLADVYTPTDKSNRYTLSSGSGAAGLMLYPAEGNDELVYAYSVHSTDPANDGHCKNAFDLVRVHLYGSQDTDADRQNKRPEELKSYKSMCRLALQDDKVKAIRLKAHSNRGAAILKSNGEDDNWRAQLEVDERTGRVKATMLNLVMILNNDPGLKNIAYNLFTGRHTVTGPVAWDRRGKTQDWDDMDDAQLSVYVAAEYGAEYKPQARNTVLSKVLDDRRYDPLVQLVEGLPEWDGKERIDTLFVDYLAADDTEYTRAAARKFCIALIAKAMAPRDFASKFDEMLVLTGPMGIGKSTLLRNIVGPEWFSDDMSLADMNGKEAAEKMQERWLVEIGELAGANKIDVNRAKSFISRLSDNYRPAYGRHVMEHPRRCLLSATSNFDDVLIDITGNRKYLVVACKKGARLDPRDITEADRQQFLAEAYFYWMTGESLEITGIAAEQAEEAQVKAMKHDDRTGLLEDYLDTPITDNWYELTIQERLKYLQNPEKARADYPDKYTGEKDRMIITPMEVAVELLGKSKMDCDSRLSRQISGMLAELATEWERPREREYVPGYGRQRPWHRRAK